VLGNRGGYVINISHRCKKPLNLGTIYLDQRIADIAITIRKKKRIKLPDAIIAATAISEGLYLVTRNVEDFHDIDLKLTNPFK
jgi:predicted nucleic acid-binding protein